MGLSQLAHPCAGCLVSSPGEKLGYRQGEETRQCSGMAAEGNNGGPQVYDPSEAGT